MCSTATARKERKAEEIMMESQKIEMSRKERKNNMLLLRKLCVLGLRRA